MKALFIPGKLTTEYFKGRHVAYVPPVRIFLTLAVIHFAILGFSGFEEGGFNFNFTGEQPSKDMRETTYEAAFWKN